jgi:Ca-activated chloride channel family protein
VQKIVLYITLSLWAFTSLAQPDHPPEAKPPLTRILFVFDGSQSMHARWESGSKIDIAQKLIGHMLDSLKSLDQEVFQLGLRVYGHLKPVPPQDCNDTRLEVPIGFNKIESIKRKLNSISPKGTTPIARSLSKSANDFTDCED